MVNDVPQYSFQYDAAGRLLQADDTADPHRPISMAYDPLDRLMSETTTLGTVSYGYDTIGRRTQMTVSGQGPVAYTYDAASRLRTITQAPLNPVDIQYDAAGRRTLLTLPNQVSTEYQYDPGSRLTALVYRNALGFLGDLTYQYDPAGNRVGVGGSFARTLLPDPVPSATYDAANRQLAFGSKVMSFDDNGSLTVLNDPDGTTTHTRDARNRLMGLSGSITATFAYDGLGRRQRLTLGSFLNEYQYDGLKPIQERDGATVQAYYLGGLGIDEVFTRFDSGDPKHLISDVLGSTVGLTDGTATIQTAYTYEPFGRTANSGPSNANTFQFAGRENDSTGLYYYRARYYHPTLQRFISEDPIGLFSGTLNYYAYARNDPLGHVDPLGLKVNYGRHKVASEELRGRLELFSEQLGRDIDVTSGDRDSATNAKAGGATQSPPLNRDRRGLSRAWYERPRGSSEGG